MCFLCKEIIETSPEAKAVTLSGRSCILYYIKGTTIVQVHIDPEGPGEASSIPYLCRVEWRR